MAASRSRRIPRSRSRSRGRSRIRSRSTGRGVFFWLVILGSVAVLLGGGCCFWLWSSGQDYEARCEQVLRQLDAGEVATLYYEAAPGLRESITEEDLAALGRKVREKFGGFRGIFSLQKLKIHVDGGGTSAAVEVVALYVEGTTLVKLSFLGDRDHPRLRGLFFP